MANLNPSPVTRFKKGQSGNPGGRPKGIPNIRNLIWEYLRDHPQVLERFVRALVEKDQHRMKTWQMLEGKPQEQLELSGGLNISVTVVRDDGPEPEPSLKTQTAP